MQTANAHPNVITSQLVGAQIVVGLAVRPEPGRAATTTATTPSPKQSRTNVPKNSAKHSPHRPVIRPTVRPSPRKGVISATNTLLTLPCECICISCMHCGHVARISLATPNALGYVRNSEPKSGKGYGHPTFPARADRPGVPTAGQTSPPARP